MKNIIKRNGTNEAFDFNKVVNAITKALVNNEVFTDVMKDELKEAINKSNISTVEQLQDFIEVELMRYGLTATAKSYILYRDKRAKVRANREMLSDLLINYAHTIANNDNGNYHNLKSLVHILDMFDSVEYEGHFCALLERYQGMIRSNNAVENVQVLIKTAIEMIGTNASKLKPEFDKIATAVLVFTTTVKVLAYRDSLGIGRYGELIKWYCEKGYYHKSISELYSFDEIELIYNELLQSDRNYLFTYAGLYTLLERYVVRSYDNQVIELPQECFLGIALFLARHQPKASRFKIVFEYYTVLSKLYLTVATPTLANARKPFHQLSSCFIDTVPDTLEGIYRSLANFAQVSKHGGGMGLYYGKVRALGSDIRGFEGCAGGVIRWIRLANDTAVAVDQLGVRQGAVSCTLDIWHKDLLEFLSMRTNNGDDRLKAHDVFPALSIPNYFYELVEKNKTTKSEMWHLFCPHVIEKIKGFKLEDYFGNEWKVKYLECVRDESIPRKTVPIIEIVKLFLKSAIETGTPFIFNRDIVNYYNPNNHCGKVYCTNLCTEIMQNTSEIKHISNTFNANGVVTDMSQGGDFVVCNLASLSLGNIFDDTVALDKFLAKIDEVTKISVSLLNDVIDNNLLPLSYAQITNNKYRAIGLGVSGYHHMLASLGVAWESDDHYKFVDQLFERINYSAISASNELAKEYGAYEYFKGSDWSTGAYFDKRGYVSDKWQALKQDVAKYGLRNGYLLAVAPTGSTSIIAGTTAGIDPIMKRFFLEEKKTGLLPRIAPNLNASTYWLYKNAHDIDQLTSIKASGIRARHIDQGTSFNLYITNNMSLSQVLNLYLEAWKNGIKSIYYIRGQALEIEECEGCAS